MKHNQIEIRNLTKKYKLYARPIDRIKEATSFGHKLFHQDFLAIDNVSFEVPQGATLGIVGRNGSGKSTLLKVICGIITPTSGTATVNGRISALLELGAGFNPELSGRENIYFTGTLQGLNDSQIAERIPEIVNFADIGQYIDQPVKTYSSGMFSRLAFAIAINVDPDILIVDEALSVGDVYFQVKCFNKFKELQARKKTVIFVTHSLDAILRYCDSAICLHHGKLMAKGSPDDVIDAYKKLLSGESASLRRGEVLASNNKKDSLWLNALEINSGALEYGNRKAKIVDYGIFDRSGHISATVIHGDEFLLKVKVRATGFLHNPIVAFTIKSVDGLDLTGTNTELEQVAIENIRPQQTIEVIFRQRMALNPGTYLVSLGVVKVSDGETEVYHRLYDIFKIDVIGNRTVVGIFNSWSQIELFY